MKRHTPIAALALTLVVLASLTMGGRAEEPIRMVELIAAMPQTLPTPIFELRPMRPPEPETEMPVAELNIEPLPSIEGEAGSSPIASPTTPHGAYDFPPDGLDRISSPGRSPSAMTQIAPVSSTQSTGYAVRQAPIRRPTSGMRPQVYVGPYTGLQPVASGGSGWIAPPPSRQSYFGGSATPNFRPSTVFTWY